MVVRHCTSHISYEIPSIHALSVIGLLGRCIPRTLDLPQWRRKLRYPQLPTCLAPLAQYVGASNWYLRYTETGEPSLLWDYPSP